ncbi:putative RND superfamily exporter [Halalkaliarchaeum desulfuricum]|uniref:Putative RND superfamily exporter n=1 Tax=Halalkaliarchaeum desulfuricum TaxID=2055893 RepID=A0A343TII2_9EURY|nr:MMPL family transporter [Halalkaliarchaeum desulfuricum]AUX08904.1 putative RND superfamily exporter [Halalkaliarchaeum desulfuricum]
MRGRPAGRIADEIVGRPGRIALAFLVVTVLLAPGVALMETEPGTEPFTEAVPEADALEQVTLRFEPTFGPDEPTTQIIQYEERNALSREALSTQLRVVEQLRDREELRVIETTSPAGIVAAELDPTADTTKQKREAIEGATQSDLEGAIRAASDDPVFTSIVSEDFSPEAGEASAAIVVTTHAIPAGDEVLIDLQHDVTETVEGVDRRLLVFGSGIVEAEFRAIIFDSLAIVIPVAAVVILGLLLAAYRDPFDLALGLTAIVMTVVWTFGVAGYVGLPFNQMLIAVPILLLAIGIDFGIHMIDRYREKRIEGRSIAESMRTTAANLLVAYGLIAGTTVIGFGANVTSELQPIREFGVVTAIGMIFTLLIFGIYLPAAKVWLDRRREALALPEFDSSPIAGGESTLGRWLEAAAIPARTAPVAFLLAALLLTGAAAGYGAGVDTTFDVDDFLPAEEQPEYVHYFPGPMQPSEYTITRSINVIEDEFVAGEEDTITIHLRTDMTDDDALRRLVRVEENPPDSFVEVDGSAQSQSILVPIALAAEENPRIAVLVSRNDRTGDGIPDRNLDAVYDEVFDSEYGDLAREYLTEDRDETRIIISVRSEATTEEVTEDARAFVNRYRGEAVATGQIIINQSVAEEIFDTAVESFFGAIIVDGIFLILLYWILTRRASLGLLALLPIAVTVALLTATMRVLGIPFNALSTTILAISIGLGVDYTVHFTHRYHIESQSTDDPIEAIETTLRGTGGALTGTMLTTTLGLGSLVLAITPILGQFGLLTGLSIIYSYLTAHLLLPSLVVVLERIRG